MERIPRRASIKLPADRCSGDVWFDFLAEGTDPSRLEAGLVHFAPCGRTAWHSHPVGQTLYLTEGVGLVATKDEVIVMRAGDVVHTPPGEVHWHGAGPELVAAHIALYEGEHIDWGDLVTEEEYAAAAAHLTDS